MSKSPAGVAPGMSLSVYASRFLAGKQPKEDSSSSQVSKGLIPSFQLAYQTKIFRPSTPPSPSEHDPFLTSPAASMGHPYLPGSSRSPSPTKTPPFPGPGIESLPDLESPPRTAGAGRSFSLSKGGPESASSRMSGSGSAKRKVRVSSVPNPYAHSSSSEDEGDIEADLDEVAAVRRSLVAASPRPGSSTRKTSDRAKRGWLAHQSVFPPSSSSSSDEESEKETEPDSDADPADALGLMGKSRREGRGRSASRQPVIEEEDEDEDEDEDGYAVSPSELYRKTERPPSYETADDLEAPLLDPDELEGREPGATSVPVRLHVYHGRFAHWDRAGLRKYKDSGFLALWLTSLICVVVALPFVWGSTDPKPSDGTAPRAAPSLLPLLPLLLCLLIPPLILPPAFLFLLRRTVRPVLLATAVSIPFSLFLCGWWALGASFETSGLDGVEQSERWWAGNGMRMVAVVLWLSAALFGRMVYLRRKRLERTAAVVELATDLLLSHPPLLLLTPVLLGVFALTSIPFLTLLLRLGTIGYWRHPRENTWVFHLRPYAGWLIFVVTLIWVWTWSVIRGIGRVAVAGVVGEWYFHRDEPTHPPPLEITTAALHRATGTSLGSICQGALIVAAVRVVGRSAAELRRVTSPKSRILPSPLSFLTGLAPVFAWVAGVLDQLNGYALVYVGITGDKFWTSARRAVGLAGRRKGGHLLDYTLIKLLLTLSSTAMGLFTATAGYLYMSHSLGHPSYAPVAALLCGGVPFLAVRAGASVLGDAADALFICHQIDRELGGQHCEKAKVAFAGGSPRGSDQV